MNPAPPSLPLAAKTHAQKALEKLGLVRDVDFALHLPLRYEDETHLSALADARHGQTVQIEAVVLACDVSLRGKRQLLVTVADASMRCELRFFNFYPSHQRALAVGNKLWIRGQIKHGKSGLTMLHPSFKPAIGSLPAVLTAVYPTVAGLPQAYVRKAVHSGLLRATQRDQLAPTIDLPGLPSLQEALQLLHHPTPDVTPRSLENHTHPAWQRLKAEELLAQQLSQLKARRERQKMRSHALAWTHAAAGEPNLCQQLRQALPFALTRAQQRVLTEIAQDLQQPKPMNRLLQGDVGSGKTVVAALAAAQCIQAGYQCALMVPTEILAQQHFAKLVGWLEPLLHSRGQSVAWLSSSQKSKERRTMLDRIACGQAVLIVGTHALLQSKVTFAKLALVVVDEQHRFGVEQRLALKEKNTDDTFAHLLMMSATPIPRTLAMSYYADLDVSTLDELPPGRTPIVTKVVSMRKRQAIVERIIAQLRLGRQVYWVCPLIEESEAIDLVNATQTHAQLQAALTQALPQIQVALLHSKIAAPEKKSIMQAFIQNDIHVLVSTTVIEVGVDVPNASLMVIEHAERFGLAQLHQLRGRVGRGAAASACVLLYATAESGRLGEAAKARLQAMVDTTDGFEIARRDLDIRGPGEFLGARQSGTQMLRFADLSDPQDQAWLRWAQASAPTLLDTQPQLAARHMERWLPQATHYLGA